MVGNKYKCVGELIGKMNLEQKVGQLFVFSFFGSSILPDTYKRILKMNCSGFRICQTERMFGQYVDPRTGKLVNRDNRVPRGQDRDLLCSSKAYYLSIKQSAELYNQVKRIAMDRPSGIPLHLVLDQEGDKNADFSRGGIHFFPSQMGLVASGEKQLCYRVSKALARQLHAVGMNMLHSPVLDVNTNPYNPEIGIRSFSDNPNVCAEFGIEMFRAFQEENIVATGKHFPGRGDASGDSHFDMQVLDIPRKQMDEIHLLPFKKLIDEGIPAIMIAHTSYPLLDPSGDIATISKPIVTGLLRKEMGFEGVITTDSISMGALVKHCGDIPEACVRSVEAGVDLVLLKDEDWITEKTYETMIEAVKTGRISESRVDESLQRTLKMKVDMGLFKDFGLVDSDKAETVINDMQIAETEKEASCKAMVLMRDNAGLLPISKDEKVLLVEQLSHLAVNANDSSCHPGIMWEDMLKHSPDNVSFLEINFVPTETDRQRILDRIDQAELIVMTNDFARSEGCGNHTDFIREIIKRGKKVVVITNTPYDTTVPEDFPTVICTHGSTPASWRYVTKVLFGKQKPKGKICVKRLK